MTATLLRLWLLLPSGAVWMHDGRWAWQRRLARRWLARYGSIAYRLEERA